MPARFWLSIFRPNILMTEVLLSTARHATDQIHDAALRCRALAQIAQLENAAGLDAQATLASAERLLWNLAEPTAQAVIACELAQSAFRIGHDPYRFLDLARSASVGGSILGEIYVALIEAKLGYHAERNLHWAEQCASVQRPGACLVQTQAAIARIQASAGNWNAAQATIRRINDPLQQIISYCELALTASREGECPWLDAVPALDQIVMLSDRVRAQCALAVTAHGIGFDASESLQHAIQLAAQIVDAQERQVATVLLARVLAQRQDIAVALRFVAALPEAVQQEARLAICEQTAEAGNFAVTRMLAESLFLPSHRNRALYCIVRAATQSLR